ncbi:MAG: alpha/beta hydrolase [Planctomycetes bacterium]|nr:alpha/beta hydrolase [Planctomycetota bacterium]
MTNRRAFAAALCVALFSAGCAAPLVVEAGREQFGELPIGGEVVRVATDDGVGLAGLLVRTPTMQTTPLVLHLLPRGGSATSGVLQFGGLHELLGALREEGFASLVIDYRGVGASAGDVDSDALGRDAAAMWRYARQLVGEQGAIVLRASSLGTLAAAALLDEPEVAVSLRALLLIAPVDARTVVGNAARERHGALLGPLLALFHRSPPIRPLADVLRERAARTPTLLVLPADDPLLPPDEAVALRAQLGEAVHCVDDPRDHEELVLRYHGFALEGFGGAVTRELPPDEAAFLRARDRGRSR